MTVMCRNHVLGKIVVVLIEHLVEILHSRKKMEMKWGEGRNKWRMRWRTKSGQNCARNQNTQESTHEILREFIDEERRWELWRGNGLKIWILKTPKRSWCLAEQWKWWTASDWEEKDVDDNNGSMFSFFGD